MIMMRQQSRNNPAAVLGILVVDDEDMVRRVVSRRFQMEGFRVWEARDGAEAVELFRVFQDEIDGILLDVRMPKMDGPETLAHLREIDPTVPACFLTGFSDKYTEEELLQRGAIHVYQKGAVNWEEMLETFRVLAQSD